MSVIYYRSGSARSARPQPSSPERRFGLRRPGAVLAGAERPDYSPSQKKIPHPHQLCFPYPHSPLQTPHPAPPCIHFGYFSTRPQHPTAAHRLRQRRNLYRPLAQIRRRRARQLPAFHFRTLRSPRRAPPRTRHRRRQPQRLHL